MNFIGRLFNNWYMKKSFMSCLKQELTSYHQNFKIFDFLEMERNQKKLLSQDLNLVIDEQAKTHHFNVTLILSTYNSLQNMGMSQKESFNILNLTLKNLANGAARYFHKALNAKKDPFVYIVDFSKKKENSFYGSSYSFSRIIDNKNAYHLGVKKCFFVNYLTQHKRLDLLPLICDMDTAWMTLVNPKTHKMSCHRDYTMATNPSGCLFVFARQNET